MTTLFDLVAPITRVTVEALLNSLWQGAALAASVWCLLRVVRRRTNATTRYVIWWVTLLAIVFLPLLAGRASSGGVETASLAALSGPPTGSSLAPSSYPEEVAHQSRQLISGGGPVRGAAVSSISLPDGWLLPVFGGWLFVAVGMLARLLWSYCHLQRLRRESIPLAPRYQRRLERWLTASGVSRSVRLCGSREASMPMAVGLADTVIIIPEALKDQLTEAEFDQVVLHELAHIRRWDDWMKLCQKLAEALFFFHPAVLWIGRWLNLEREVACDDWVISMTGDRRPYAACLARLAELAITPRAPVLAPGSLTPKKQVSRRIEAILDSKRNAAPRLSKVRFTVTSCVLIVAVVLCGRVSPVIAVAGPPQPHPVESAITAASTGDEQQGLEPRRSAPAASVRESEARPDAGLAVERRAGLPEAEPRGNAEEGSQGESENRTRAADEQKRREIEQRMRQLKEPQRRGIERPMRGVVGTKRSEIETQTREAIEPRAREAERLVREQEEQVRRHEKQVREQEEQVRRHEKQVRELIEPRVREAEKRVREAEKRVREAEKKTREVEGRTGVSD
jgi:beta-lactamase regulating signal transducer with metallopeptidase domain